MAWPSTLSTSSRLEVNSPHIDVGTEWSALDGSNAYSQQGMEDDVQGMGMETILASSIIPQRN